MDGLGGEVGGRGLGAPSKRGRVRVQGCEAAEVEQAYIMA